MKIWGKLICSFVAFAGCTVGTDDASTSSTEDAVTAIKMLRGVDRAGQFSVNEARLLKRNHGVEWTGVYIGGPCNGGFGWSKSGVSAIAAHTGWKFMPIYVGQQSSSICGAHHLTYLQGEHDGRAAVAHMKQFGWEPNRDIPVALDVEAGTYFGAESASTHYVHGWVHAVHHAGYRAYVYGSPYGLDHFHDAGVRIDAAWGAAWTHHGFAAIGTSGLTAYLGHRWYHHHDRAWQYSGGFAVAGAGDVDADVSNLLLAPKPGGTNRTTTMHAAVPANCGVLDAGEGLGRGESIASCDGVTSLALDANGELALSVNGNVTWRAGTDGVGESVVMQDTGELVVFDADGEAVFETATYGFPEAHVAIDGGLAIVDETDNKVWTDRNGLMVDDAEVHFDEDLVVNDGD